MLLGGFGPSARDVVARVAAGSGLELLDDGPLALAAPVGALTEARAGGVRLWLTGWIDLGDLPIAPPAEQASAPEILATAFDRLGQPAQALVHGEYLIVTRQHSRQTVRVAHDHLGGRTLSYARSGSNTFFAEHIVDLLALLPATPAPDRPALVQWIDAQTLPFHSSLFSGIVRLGPGEALLIEDRRVTVERFWRPRYVEPPAMSAGDAAAAVASAAFAAIDRASAGLERPAVKLSGGLDSACVAVGLAAASRGRPTLAFSATFADYPEIDESPLLEQTAQTTGLELVKVPHIDVPLIDGALTYIRRWMLPPLSPNHPFWSRLVAQARARDVDGLFDGEGGDELFSVAPYLIADELRRGRALSAWSLAGRLPGLGSDPGTRLRLKALRAYGVSGAVPRFAQRLRRRLRNTRAGVDTLVLDQDVPGLVDRDETWSWKDGEGPLWWRAAVNVIVDGGHRLDASGELARDATAAGVGRRHPFLHDAQLIEAVLAVPPEHQFDPVRDRPLLRDGLRGAIPEAVRTRHAKSYFDELVTRHLSGPEGERLVARLLSPTSPLGGYVRREGLEELVASGAVQGSRRHLRARRLFWLFCVDAWLRCLEDRGASATVG